MYGIYLWNYDVLLTIQHIAGEKLSYELDSQDCEMIETEDTAFSSLGLVNMVALMNNQRMTQKISRVQQSLRMRGHT